MKKKFALLSGLSILAFNLGLAPLALATEDIPDVTTISSEDSQLEDVLPLNEPDETEEPTSGSEIPESTTDELIKQEAPVQGEDSEPALEKKTQTEANDNDVVSKEIVNQYVTITKDTAPLYDDLSVAATQTTANYLNQTLLAKEKITQGPNQIFYGLFNNQSKFVGYVHERDLVLANNSAGTYQTYGKHVTITNKNYTIWSNFQWTFKNKTSNYHNKTFLAKGVYNHFNGSRFLSLYTSQGKWIGYLNENATRLPPGPQGFYQSLGKYVTVKNGNYDLWHNFKWDKKTKASTLLNQTVLARGVYQHYNGARYLSLYTQKGVWLGYLNQNATQEGSGPQGAYQPYGKYVTVTHNNYPVWQNFNWKNKNTTKNLYQQTLQARGRYRHFNGSTYLSLYNSKGIWQGYLNEKATKLGKNKGGAPLKLNKYITVKSKNYTIWSNLNFTKGKSTSSMVNKPYHVTYQYKHFNGSTYYSLYDSNNVWQGYLNVTGLSQVSGNNSTYVLMNAPFIDQNSAGAPMGCEAASLLEALHVKGYAKKYTTLKPFLNEMPLATDKNPHNGFAGSPWNVTYGIYQSIFAKPLAKWGNKYAKNKVVDLSGTPFNQLKNELTKGNPLVVYVTLDFQKGYWSQYFWGKGVDNAHIMTVDGYNSKTNQYHVSDPNRGKYWVSASKFETAYNLTKGVVVVK